MKPQVRVSLDALRHVQERGGRLFVWREGAVLGASTEPPPARSWSRQRAGGFDLFLPDGIAPAPLVRVELRALPEPTLVAYDDALQT